MSCSSPVRTLDDIFSYRIETGQGPMDLDGYRSDQLERLHDGKSIQLQAAADGRPRAADRFRAHAAAGGWVATHQDITEATQAKRRSATLRAMMR